MVALSKATPIEPAAVDDLADRIERDASLTDDDGWRPALDRLDYWFRLDVSADLARLRRLIRTHADEGPLRRLAPPGANGYNSRVG